MASQQAIATLSSLAVSSSGVFRGTDAVRLGVTRKQLATFRAAGILERLLPDTYRMTSAKSGDQPLRAALLWAGAGAAAAGRSAGEVYELEGVAAANPEIVVSSACRVRSPNVVVHRSDHRAELMIRTRRGLRVVGVEPTLVTLADALDGEALEIACEDARRRRLTSIPALRAHLERYPHRRGASPLRGLLRELDAVHPSRSTLEVKTRRLLVAHGITDFVREFPLDWNGATYYFDFAFDRARSILETNSKQWHADPLDYEYDNEKWSVPGRHGYRLTFATWDKVAHHPNALIDELYATLAA
jgi:hypothetical protein